jgi:hypothetical protein
MARTPSFHFGANTKLKKAAKKGGGKKPKKSSTGGARSWRAYVGISNAPIPD